MNRADSASLAVIFVSLLAIAATWTVFSVTVDEPMHVSAALELYTQHAYTYQPENPPLPRLVFGLAPWLAGMDFDPARPKNEQLQGVFHSDGRYRTNLVLARAGTLVFFIIASLSVWGWARRELGSNGALVATLLFSLQPVISGFAGLATHDMPATAGLALSLFVFSRWLAEPGPMRAATLGAAYGFAVLCKFSCIGYVPVACLAMLVVRAMRERDLKWRALAQAFAVALPAALLVVWAGYAFTIQPLLAGIRGLAAVDRAGHFAYFFGDVRTHGWWWYFPTAVALKSTIPSLVLALCARRRGVEALAAALSIFAIPMFSHLNLGVRFVLPLYAPLAVAGAAGAIAFRRRWIPIVLLVWHIGAAAVAYPDSFPYFNEAAGRQPWRLLGDSNIDWGQDVLRLKEVIDEKKIDRIGLALSGWHRPEDLGFPPHHEAFPTLPTQGWIAVSEHLFQIKRFPWLRGRSYERVGRSIRLYYVP